MRTILFVDDEPHLLSGLRRRLRGVRADWQVAFAASGPEALQQLAARPFDVVVTDMRMPGMDGAQLLTQVRLHYPSTSRMVLSGHADRASIISAIGPTQQYLTKPCDLDTLVETLDRVLAVRDLVGDERLRTILGGVESLPKPPGIYGRMLELAADPECRIGDVVDVIEQDVATSAELLHLVNSSFFGLAHRVESVGRAVGLLGLETIQALAVAGAVFRQAGPAVPGLDLPAVSRRGVQVGRRAHALATAEHWPRAATQDVFFSGLLHEVGLIVLAAGDPAGWSAVRRCGALDPFEQRSVQSEVFGCSATQASAYLLGLWGFDPTVVEPIAGQPARPDDAAATAAARLLTTARLAVPDGAARPAGPGPTG